MEKTIMETLNEVADYRTGNAIRHKLAEVLMIGLLTFICNGNDYAAMHLFGKTHEERLREFLELPHGIPSQDTFERIFQKINPEYLSANFISWMDEIRDAIYKSGTNINVSIDGKTIRRSKRIDKKAVHVVSAFASDLRLVLGQIAIDKKSNEITAIPELLEMFCRKGMVITIDAMGTQTAIAEKIIEKDADYVLSVKGNQETLHTDIRLLMKYELFPLDKIKLLENGQYAKTVEKGHGRIETRECYICTDVDWLSKPSDWSRLVGYGVINSKREELGKSPVLNSEYFIFSLKNTNATEILHIKRSHWAIENNLHWMLDVVFREDDSRATLGYSPENLNILRKQSLRLMSQDDSFKASMRSKRLRCAWDIEYAFKIVGVK